MKFVVYKDRKKQWRWKLVARNGRKIADSAEGYLRPSTMMRQIHNIASDCRRRPIPVIGADGGEYSRA